MDKVEDLHWGCLSLKRITMLVGMVRFGETNIPFELIISIHYCN